MTHLAVSHFEVEAMRLPWPRPRFRVSSSRVVSIGVNIQLIDPDKPQIAEWVV